VNQAGRDALIRHLEQLAPTDHHFHLEPYLKVETADDAVWADVTLVDDSAL
jgi:hypothetical protein